MKSSVKSIIDSSGLDCLAVDVECHIANGLPSLNIIGYASRAVEEARDRIRAGFSSSSLQLPKKKITINLAPADIPKDSTALDLAIAVSILNASGQINQKNLDSAAFMGELGLDGEVRPVRGLIGKLLEGQKDGAKNFYIPRENLKQANLIPGIAIKPVDELKDVFLDLSDVQKIKPAITDGKYIEPTEMEDDLIDISEISGQPLAKRALEIAAAGHHNILLHGPPGTGKTMLAKAMRGILPDLSHDEVLEVTHIHSLGSGDRAKIVTKRPFRSPHHTSSTTALVGGGTNPRPGETSLAHRGVLFLDELPEFSRSSLESLRQPLEDGFVTISRVKDTATYPAAFILVATQNPCPCGYFGTNRICECSPSAIARYRKKVSGPILDRIDLHLPVSGINHEQILARPDNLLESQKVKERVNKAYTLQQKRFAKYGKYNASMSNKEIKALAKLSSQAKKLLDEAAAKLDLSARAYVRTVKVARTIADLDESESIEAKYVGEALQYRQPLEYA